MGFSRQEHWSGLPLPPVGDLPNPKTEHTSPESPALAERFFTTELPNPPPKCFLKNSLNIPKKFLFQLHRKLEEIFKKKIVLESS